MKIRNKQLHVLLIIVLVFVLYFNTFFNGFIFDDQFFIVDNFKIRSLRNIPSFFARPSVGNLYRPFRDVLYSVTYFIWKLNPIGYHLNAILLHAAVSVAVYLLVCSLVDGRKLALIVSLLFVAHPIHTARVANMTGGFELIGILFLFLAFYSYVLFRKNSSNKAFIFSIVFFIFGLFSSEEAIIFPFLAFFYDFCFVEGASVFSVKILKKKIRYFWPYIVSIFFYLLVRFSVLRQIGRSEVYFLGDFFTRIFSTLVIFLRYILILVFPTNLTVDYNVVQYKSFSFVVFLAVIFFLVVLYFWIKTYGKNKMVFFSIGWFFIALLPFSNIFPVYTFMADRYLYSASFGFVLLLGYLLSRIANLRLFDRKLSKVFLFILVFILVFYGYMTIVRNSEWNSDYLLLSKAVERQPLSSSAHNDLGQVYQSEKRYVKALNGYEAAVRLNNRNHVAWLNLGTLYGEVGNYSLAIYYINRSLSILESYKAYNNLGLIYYREGNLGKAEYFLKEAIEFDPYLSKAYMDLGIIYAQRGDFEDALGEFHKALGINPNVADIHYNLGILYRVLNQSENADREFSIALGLNPDLEVSG